MGEAFDWIIGDPGEGEFKFIQALLIEGEKVQHRIDLRWYDQICVLKTFPDEVERTNSSKIGLNSRFDKAKPQAESRFPIDFN